MPLMMRRAPRATLLRAAPVGKARTRGTPGGQTDLEEALGEVSEAPDTSAGAAAPVETPSVGALVGAYIGLGVGGAVSVWVWNSSGQAVFTPASGIGVFAPLYVFAQTIERILEPLAGYVGDKKGATKNVYDALKADKLQAAAEAQQNVDQIRRNRGVLVWASACVLGMLASAGCGALLLNAIGLGHIPGWLDVVVSGLVIGSGTKPLHDLITNIQKAKEEKEDPPERVAA